MPSVAAQQGRPSACRVLPVRRRTLALRRRRLAGFACDPRAPLALAVCRSAPPPCGLAPKRHRGGAHGGEGVSGCAASGVNMLQHHVMCLGVRCRATMASPCVPSVVSATSHTRVSPQITSRDEDGMSSTRLASSGARLTSPPQNPLPVCVPASVPRGCSGG